MAVSLSEHEHAGVFLPAIETSVFDDNPSAHIWVGKVALGPTVLMPTENTGLHRLRANVYIDETRFLPASHRSDDGGEYDSDDIRSAHFVVIENHRPTKRVVGGVRLVEKRNEEDLLPAEKYFPEGFIDDPAEIGSVEISRLIARNPNQALQQLVAMAAIRAIDLYAINNKVPNSYAVVEKPMQKWLRIIGVPNEPLADYKVLSDYGNTVNTVVRIRPEDVLETALNAKGRRVALRHFYESALEQQGLGHYNPSEIF